MTWVGSLGILFAFMPVYFVLRLPFFRLPLHIDTGFYVSNNTVANKSFRFSKGWNARYAGCSKVVPECIYSLVFLIGAHFKKSSHSNYAIVSRVCVSIYNFASAIIVGFAACTLTHPDPWIFLTAAIVYALVSSEAQYGVYHENGELFEIPFHAATLMFLASGLTAQNPTGIAAAAFVAMLGTCFVKLSSIITHAFLFIAVAIAVPVAILPILAGGTIATCLYIAWIMINRQSPIALVSSLWGHETACGQRVNLRTISDRLTERVRGFARVVVKQPLFPLLAIAGLVLNPSVHWTAYALMIGMVATYLFQAADCWYYRIPLLLPLALLATNGIVALQSFVTNDIAIIFPVICLWVAHNTLRAAKMNRDQLTHWVWEGHISSDLLAGDLDLEAIAHQWRTEINHRSLFVYGSFNQACVLFDAAYPTPIVVAERYLDDMSVGWQGALSAQLVANTPAFILDSGNVFDAATTRNRLGLDYRLIAIHGSQFRLFKHEDKHPPCGDIKSTRTFRPQSATELRHERERSLVVPTATVCDTADQDSNRLHGTLSHLQNLGCSRIAVYGAGRFTARHAGILNSSPIDIVAILDDNADQVGPRFLDWPVERLENANPDDIDAILIASDRYAATMHAKARNTWANQFPVIRWDH